MALSSTAFMAAPGLYGTSLDKIDCSDILAAILLSDTSILGQIPMKGVAKNIEHKWIEDALNAVYVSGISTASNKLYISTPSASADVTKIIRTNAILYPDSGEFYVKFGSAPVTGLNTVSVYGNSTWASTTTAGTKWYVVAMPYADISDASADISNARTIRKCYTQVFERVVHIAKTRKSVDVWAVPDELQHQIKLRTYEIKRELNFSVISGMALYSSATFTPDSELRTMNGIIQQLRDPDLDATLEDTLVTNASGALTATLINNLAENIFNAGGLDEQSDAVIVVPAYQNRVITAFEKDKIRRPPTDKSVGNFANKFISDLGYEFPIIVDRWMPKDKLLIMDKKRIALMPLQGDAWHSEKMAVTGRSEKWQISGQYCLEVRNAEQAHGLLYNLSTS
jgi:hypothetical protein